MIRAISFDEVLFHLRVPFQRGIEAVTLRRVHLQVERNSATSLHHIEQNTTQHAHQWRKTRSDTVEVGFWRLMEKPLLLLPLLLWLLKVLSKPLAFFIQKKSALSAMNQRKLRPRIPPEATGKFEVG